MEEIGSESVAEKLAAAALTRPREFVRAVHWLGGVLQALDRNEAGEALSSASKAYTVFAQKLTEMDGEQARALFEDLAMPKMVVSLGAGSRASAARVDALVRVLARVFACDTTSLTNLINQLEESIDDAGAFLRVLECFVRMGGALDVDLLHLYARHASNGLGMEEVAARVASLGLLNAICRLPSGSEAIGGKYGQILKLLSALTKTPEPWDVHAGVVTVAARLIAPAESGSVEEQGSVANQMLAVINNVFGPEQPLRVRLVGLVALAPILRAHPSLLGKYVQTMCSLDPGHEDTASVLGFAEVPTRLGPYPLHAAPVAWRHTGAASLVAAQVAAVVTALENIEAIHLQVSVWVVS